MINIQNSIVFKYVSNEYLKIKINIIHNSIQYVLLRNTSND